MLNPFFNIILDYELHFLKLFESDRTAKLYNIANPHNSTKSCKSLHSGKPAELANPHKPNTRIMTRSQVKTN